MGKHVTIYLSDEYLTKLELVKAMLGTEDIQDTIRKLIDGFYELAKCGLTQRDWRDVVEILYDFVNTFKKFNLQDIDKIDDKQLFLIFYDFVQSLSELAKKHGNKILRLSKLIKEEQDNEKIVRCPYCGAILAKIGGTKERAELVVSGEIIIDGNKVFCGKCGKELPDDVAKRLGIVKTGDVIMFGVGFDNVVIGNNYE